MAIDVNNPPVPTYKPTATAAEGNIFDSIKDFVSGGFNLWADIELAKTNLEFQKAQAQYNAQYQASIAPQPVGGFLAGGGNQLVVIGALALASIGVLMLLRK